MNDDQFLFGYGSRELLPEKNLHYGSFLLWILRLCRLAVNRFSGVFDIFFVIIKSGPTTFWLAFGLQVVLPIALTPTQLAPSAIFGAVSVDNLGEEPI